MKINLVKKENDLFRNDFKKQLIKSLSSAKFILGPDVKKLEDNLSNYIGCKYSIAVSSGTDALLLSLMTINIKPGDEIITTPFTWISNVEVIKLLKAKPVFVDIDKDTFNLDFNLIKKKITKKTKAILAVSLFGQCSELFELKKICNDNKIYLIEDAAQSFGAKIKNYKSCNIADISCTSFFPTKVLGCLGDGGACFTNNLKLADKLKRLRNHGKDKKGKFIEVGLNGRLDTLQASFLLIKLKKIDFLIKKRNEAAQFYNKHLNSLIDNITLPHIKKNYFSVYSQYTLKVKNKRNKLYLFLKSKNIDVKIFYKPIYLEKAYKANSTSFENCNNLTKQVLSIPISSSITRKYQLYVIKSIKEFYE